MKRFSRVVCVFLSSVVLSSYVWANPEVLSVLGLGDEIPADLLAKFAKEESDLIRRQEITMRRIEAKSAIMQDLVTGKLTLLQAARWFQELNQSPLDCQNNYYMQDANISAGEKVCRQVIQWARGDHAELTQRQQDELIRRLEAELEAHLRKNHGTVVFGGT